MSTAACIAQFQQYWQAPVSVFNDLCSISPESGFATCNGVGVFAFTMAGVTTYCSQSIPQVDWTVAKTQPQIDCVGLPGSYFVYGNTQVECRNVGA